MLNNFTGVKMQSRIDYENVSKRFFENIKINNENNCWEWQKSLANGYGVLYLMSVKGQSLCQRAHRYSWIIHFGEIPYKKFVLHRCDNRKCVNPRHLFLGNAKDNYDDMLVKGRAPFQQRKIFKQSPKPLVYTSKDNFILYLSTESGERL